MSKITLIAKVNEEREAYFGAIDVPDFMVKQFEPMDVCNDPLLRCFTGSVSDEQAITVIKARKETAEELAKYLADFIYKAMCENDTKNGYRS